LDYELVRGTLTRFIRDETARAGLGRAVVGVSGGVDSAVAVTLAAEALGKDNVLGVLMPYTSSSPASAADATVLLANIGVRSETHPIAPVVDPFVARDGSMNRVRRGNVMARARMMTLFDISARDGAIVVGTSNRTEILLGYGTLFGDTACGLNPVGDLYKTQVWALAAYLGVPDVIIDKPPTADLWEGQTDEEEFGFGYSLADRILFHMVDEEMDVDGVVKLGFDERVVRLVHARMERNRFKSRPVPIARIPRPGSRREAGDPGSPGN